jgi:uncharacterized membrane protein YbhN (UPF0104 family)
VTLRRILALALTAVVLYGLAPALANVFSAWPRLRHVHPAWFAVIVVAQALSLLCLAKLQALCVGVPCTRGFLRSVLVSGAVGRVLPGGTATAAATQSAILVHAGVPGPAIGVGLGVAALLQLAALCALPLLAVPAVALGLSVPNTLATTAAVAAVIFVALVAAALLVRHDRVVRTAGRVIAAAIRRLGHGTSAAADLPARLVAQRDDVIDVLRRRWKQALGTTAGRWLFDFLTLQAALAAIGARPSLALALLAFSATQLLGQLPLTPGGLGVVEAGLTATLTVAGASAGQAAVGTLAYRLVSYWLVVAAGLAAWLIGRRAESGALPRSR